MRSKRFCIAQGPVVLASAAAAQPQNMVAQSPEMPWYVTINHAPRSLRVSAGGFTRGTTCSPLPRRIWLFDAYEQCATVRTLLNGN